MHYIVFFSSLITGYFFNFLTTRPNSKINKRFPDVRIKFIQIFPRVQIHYKHKTIWVHHWIHYSIILIITLTCSVGWLDSLYSKGYLVGAIIQGLTFPDWKKIIINNKLSNLKRL